MPKVTYKPGARVEVLPPVGDRWLAATMKDYYGTVIVDMLADPVWGGCELKRNVYRRVRRMPDGTEDSDGRVA